jgi:hypothetical protein
MTAPGASAKLRTMPGTVTQMTGPEPGVGVRAQSHG